MQTQCTEQETAQRSPSLEPDADAIRADAEPQVRPQNVRARHLVEESSDVPLVHFTTYQVTIDPRHRGPAPDPQGVQPDPWTRPDPSLG